MQTSFLLEKTKNQRTNIIKKTAVSYLTIIAISFLPSLSLCLSFSCVADRGFAFNRLERDEGNTKYKKVYSIASSKYETKACLWIECSYNRKTKAIGSAVATFLCSLGRPSPILMVLLHNDGFCNGCITKRILLLQAFHS